MLAPLFYSYLFYIVFEELLKTQLKATTLSRQATLLRKRPSALGRLL